MKYILPILSLVLLFACQPKKESEPAPRPDGNVQVTTSYDSILAAELGADDYGMRSYVLVILKAGPTPVTDSLQSAEMFKGHFANMSRLAEEGKLVMAGPFGDEWAGLFIFSVDTIEEAQALAESDPTIKAGHFVAEYHPWYGSAALVQMNELHERIAKVEI